MRWEDRHPTPTHAPDYEIEVTPVMIEASLALLYSRGTIENPILENDRDLVGQSLWRRVECARFHLGDKFLKIFSNVQNRIDKNVHLD
jgi:hypothetical protein